MVGCNLDWRSPLPLISSYAAKMGWRNGQSQESPFISPTQF